MTAKEKMTQRLEEWRAGLEAMERKLTELTFQIERQRGAIAAGEALLVMGDDEVVTEGVEPVTEEAKQSPAAG